MHHRGYHHAPLNLTKEFFSYKIIFNLFLEIKMSRVIGDNNLSSREKRKDAQIAALKAEVAVQKAKTNVEKARGKELREKLSELKKTK
jgi:hypothetical protein